MSGPSGGNSKNVQYCMNAALKPVIDEYLSGLVAAVKETAHHEEIYLMHADGGVLQPTEIAQDRC